MTATNVAGMRSEPVPNALVECLLRLGDDRLVLGHRLSEWCAHGPILEEDIALANIALDLVGHASAWLSLAGELEGRGRNEDALAYFREAVEYRNALMVELPKGDFGFTIVRQFLFDAYSVLLLDALSRATHERVAAIAAKCLKEDKYHLRHSSEWVCDSATARTRVMRGRNVHSMPCGDLRLNCLTAMRWMMRWCVTALWWIMARLLRYGARW